MSHTIIRPGENVWRVETGDRAGFLIDGQAYFAAVRSAILKAERSLFIVGWDIDSRIDLVRPDPKDGAPAPLGEVIAEATRRHPELIVRILVWDFAVIYALEREWFARLAAPWQGNKRIRFVMDNHHPVGASHHQKMVVVDDRVAFVGGFDLSRWRWDTPAHRPDEPRRVDPVGSAYPPFHDVAMVMDNDAAVAVGELARERWRKATGERVEGTAGSGDRWPDDVAAPLTDIPIGLARTAPEIDGDPGVREGELLYQAAIANAERCIYIENQYLSSHVVTEALVARLEEEGGPTVILILPRRTGGWLEQATMDALRGRAARRLSEADKGGRLRFVYPAVEGLEPDAHLMVHAKVMVVDDRFVRVGSANLSNRSMGFDTELCVAVEREEADPIITRFRHELLSRFIGVEIDEIERVENADGPLAVVDQLNGEGRGLVRFEEEAMRQENPNLPDSFLLDPERRINAEEIVEYILPGATLPTGRLWLTLSVLALLAGGGFWIIEKPWWSVGALLLGGALFIGRRRRRRRPKGVR